MPKLVAFTIPSGETVHLNPEFVSNVHAVFKGEGWAEGARTVIIYDTRVQGVREELDVVLKRLAE